MLAVQYSPAGRFLDRLGADLRRPRGIVVASTHFLAASPAVGAAANPATIHDFGGFTRELYGIQVPGGRRSGAVAADVAGRLSQAGFKLEVSATHGIDHGVWVPLRRMYPQATFR